MKLDHILDCARTDVGIHNTGLATVAQTDPEAFHAAMHLAGPVERHRMAWALRWND